MQNIARASLSITEHIDCVTTPPHPPSYNDVLHDCTKASSRRIKSKFQSALKCCAIYIRYLMCHKGGTSVSYVPQLWYIEVPPLWFPKLFTPFHQKFTISNKRICHQQLWNVSIIVVIELYFSLKHCSFGFKMVFIITLC